MTPARLKEIIQKSTEELGAIFFFGKTPEAALDLIQANTSGGYVFMESDISEKTDFAADNQTYQVKIAVLTADRPDSVAMTENEEGGTASDALMFAMYNLKADLINYINENYTDEIEAEQTTAVMDVKIQLNSGLGIPVTGVVLALDCKTVPDC